MQKVRISCDAECLTDQSQQLPTGKTLLNCCYFMESMLLLFKPNRCPLEVFRISALPSALQEPGLQNPPSHCSSIFFFFFWQPKIKFNQHAAGISNSVSQEHSRAENRRRIWNKSPNAFTAVTKKIQRGLPSSRPLPLPSQLTLCTHVCLRAAILERQRALQLTGSDLHWQKIRERANRVKIKTKKLKFATVSACGSPSSYNLLVF